MASEIILYRFSSRRSRAIDAEGEPSVWPSLRLLLLGIRIVFFLLLLFLLVIVGGGGRGPRGGRVRAGDECERR